MAVAAEFAHVGNGPELVLAAKNVAEGAVTGSNRPMDKLLLPHPGVALFGYACRFLICGIIARGRGVFGAVGKKKYNNCNNNGRRRRRAP